MNATRRLREAGQSIWLDNITRGNLRDGTLRRYIEELSVTGLTTNPTIFLHALAKGNLYDDASRKKGADGYSSRFPELPRAFRRFRSRSSAVCRST